MSARQARATENSELLNPELSFSKQYDLLFKGKPDSRLRLPHPSLDAQAHEPGAEKLPFSDVIITKKLNIVLNRESWTYYDILVGGFIGGLHALCLAAPFTFTWPAFWTGLVLYCLSGACGIDVSFHRQLTHRSFHTPKLVEYLLAYCGTLGCEGDPISWVKHHRFHHQNTDTALDPHSSYEGFFWSHCGWLLHNKVLDARAGDNWIVKDLLADPFYAFLEKTYTWHILGQFWVLYAIGGLPFMIWAGAVRQVALWHVTWLVNSACHIWGSRPYDNGDLSTNCWWLAIPTFGEAWHNSHHAFPFSARHGLEWYQVDIAWYIIKTLQLLGLATDIRLPSEAQKRKLARITPLSAPVIAAEVEGEEVATSGGDAKDE